MGFLVLVPLLILCLIQPPVVRCGTRPSFVSDEMIAATANVVNACQTQTGVATKDIEAVRNSVWPESRELKCYMYCLWEQFGLVDDKRELNLDGMLSFVRRIRAYRSGELHFIPVCHGYSTNMAKDDNCEYAYTFNKCYAELSPQTYYLF
ncbi:general odorant-binding protein 69a-like isoform X2 [Colletes gigas]|uniref:general odorant-binding protein 69a-like isoform X2 n=1 Tax=Colletes gigas TaxID=935657 RepID=UPI001C9A8F31|nr:general odorant-binding protein 69a-like isoform X2 [Colletes gigas]